MNLYINIIEKSICVIVVISQSVNVLMTLFRLKQTLVYKKHKNKLNMLTVSSWFYWTIFVGSIIACCAIFGSVGHRDANTMAVAVIFILGHALCTYLLFSQLFWRIEYCEETVTVYGFFKKVSVERKELQISESRNIIRLSVDKKKIAEWDSRCVNFQEEANLIKFILSRK